MTLILRNDEERKWLDEHGDQKLEVVKTFGSAVSVQGAKDVDDVLADWPHYKEALLADLARQAGLAVGVSDEEPLRLSLQAIRKSGGVRYATGRAREYRKGDTVEVSFNELTYDVPAMCKDGDFGRKLARVIRDGGGLRIQVTFGLLYNQTTIKAELQRAASLPAMAPIDALRLAAAPPLSALNEAGQSAQAKPGEPTESEEDE